MKLSVVIPCFNEKKTVQTLLRSVTAAPYPTGITAVEIIVIDDCSTDGSREILEKIALNPEQEIELHGLQTFKLLLQRENGGKGRALRHGFQVTTGEIIMVQDSDLEYSPDDYPALLRPILVGNADVVFGSRFIGLERRVLYYHHYLVNIFLTFLSNLFTNLNLTDMECCYKIMRRSVLERLHLVSDHFGIEPELTAKVAKLKVRVFEVGISYNGRTYEEGKKITAIDGLAALWYIFRFNLFP